MRIWLGGLGQESGGVPAKGSGKCGETYQPPVISEMSVVQPSSALAVARLLFTAVDGRIRCGVLVAWSIRGSERGVGRGEAQTRLLG